jgi:hypothetical protein
MHRDVGISNLCEAELRDYLRHCDEEVAFVFVNKRLITCSDQPKRAEVSSLCCGRKLSAPFEIIPSIFI